MSLHQTFKNNDAAGPVLTTRDVLFRLALGEFTQAEIKQLEIDIYRFETTGMASARILKLLSAAKAPENKVAA